MRGAGLAGERGSRRDHPGLSLQHGAAAAGWQLSVWPFLFIDCCVGAKASFSLTKHRCRSTVKEGWVCCMSGMCSAGQGSGSRGRHPCCAKYASPPSSSIAPPTTPPPSPPWYEPIGARSLHLTHPAIHPSILFVLSYIISTLVNGTFPLFNWVKPKRGSPLCTNGDIPAMLAHQVVVLPCCSSILVSGFFQNFHPKLSMNVLMCERDEEVMQLLKYTIPPKAPWSPSFINYPSSLPIASYFSKKRKLFALKCNMYSIKQKTINKWLLCGLVRWLVVFSF